MDAAERERLERLLQAADQAIKNLDASDPDYQPSIELRAHIIAVRDGALDKLGRTDCGDKG